MRKLDVRLWWEELARGEDGNGVTPASAAQLLGTAEAGVTRLTDDGVLDRYRLFDRQASDPTRGRIPARRSPR